VKLKFLAECISVRVRAAQAELTRFLSGPRLLPLPTCRRHDVLWISGLITTSCHCH
jgi:hypothetical protein